MISKLKSFICKIDVLACILGNICIVVNMVIIVFNIFMRNVFKWSLNGITDYAGFISCLIVVLCIAYTESKDGNPKVDFIMVHLPMVIQKVIYVIVSVLDTVVAVALSYSFFDYAASSLSSGTTSMNAKLPYTPFLIVCGFGMALFALTIVVKTLDKILNWGGEQK